MLFRSNCAVMLSGNTAVSTIPPAVLRRTALVMLVTVAFPPSIVVFSVSVRSGAAEAIAPNIVNINTDIIILFIFSLPCYFTRYAV
ncbi:Uncharacterised protein [uncultured archaeon]|nr:Uncharacterised protein [uncultured archaeon]